MLLVSLMLHLMYHSLFSFTQLENVTVSLGDSKRNSTASLASTTAASVKSEKVQVEQLNKDRKEEYKKMKKKKKKAGK